MSTSSTSPPISALRLKQITHDACQIALNNSEYYEHSKTESWNTTIINTILRSLISESSSGSESPSFKFAVNSTIIQHLVSTAELQRTKATLESPLSKLQIAENTDVKKIEAIGVDGKPHVGRRGMHSATGAYWNDKTDGMWSFKYEGGESKGMDVVISIIWIAI